MIKKHFETKLHYYVHYFDCNQLSSQLSSADAIDHALEYFLQHYHHCSNLSPSLLVLDNLNALCPSLSSDEQQSVNILDHLKSLKFTTLLTKLAESQQSKGVAMMGIVRHYMQSLAMKLLDVGCFDTMVEMQAPSKEARYQIIKDIVVSEDMRTKEVQMQRLAQMTEYFNGRDLVEIAKRTIEGGIIDNEERHIEDTIA
jgi:SpoVK/Ycf46/Vps4 family AAA+-type ATPase